MNVMKQPPNKQNQFKVINIITKCNCFNGGQIEDKLHWFGGMPMTRDILVFLGKKFVFYLSCVDSIC